LFIATGILKREDEKLTRELSENQLDLYSKKRLDVLKVYIY
jgi:hypothetical protein